MNPNALTAGLRPTHPGEILREDILPALGRKKTEIASLLGVSRQTVYDILGERQNITPGMALRIGKLTGSRPELWLNLQHAFDLRLAEAEYSEALKRIPTLTTPN